MPRLTLVRLALPLCIPLAACGNSTSTAAADEARPGWFAALCAAGGLAADGDVPAADRLFYNDAHEALHALARELSESGRGAAARLLETKQSVESGLEEEPPPDDLSARFEDLLAATQDGLTVDGTPVDGCPVGGDA